MSLPNPKNQGVARCGRWGGIVPVAPAEPPYPPFRGVGGVAVWQWRALADVQGVAR